MVINTGGVIALSKSQAGVIEEFVVMLSPLLCEKYGVEDQSKLGMRTLLDRGCTCVGCLLACWCWSWRQVAR